MTLDLRAHHLKVEALLYKPFSIEPLENDMMRISFEAAIYRNGAVTIATKEPTDWEAVYYWTVL